MATIYFWTTFLSFVIMLWSLKYGSSFNYKPLGLKVKYILLCLIAAIIPLFNLFLALYIIVDEFIGWVERTWCSQNSFLNREFFKTKPK